MKDCQLGLLYVLPCISTDINITNQTKTENNVCSVSDTGDSEKNPISPNRSGTYDILVTSPDAPPLSYRRLVEAKAIKLGSCDKRPAYC